MSEIMEEDTRSDSVEEEEFWYQDELTLAAELGKSLLERNKELETQLGQIYHEKHELNVENNILQKQIETLRELGHSKMRIYEEVDRSAQEFEKQNKKYARESKADKERIKRLNETIENQDFKIEDLQDEIEEQKARERQKIITEKPKRKSLSLNTLQDLLDMPNYGFRSNLTPDQLRNLPFTPQEAEIKRLQESVKNLQSRLSLDQKKLDDLESDYLAVVQENIDLSNQVTEMNTKLENAKQIQTEFNDLQLQNGLKDSYICASCGVNDREIKHRPQSEIYEHDIHEIKDGLFLKLHDGGNAYGSQGSLHNAGLEGEILKTPTEPKPNVTLLSELDQTYHKLVQKYEALVDAKAKFKSPANSPLKTRNMVSHNRTAPDGNEHDVISIEIQTDDIFNHDYHTMEVQTDESGSNSYDTSNYLDTLSTECQTDLKLDVYSLTCIQNDLDVTDSDSQTDSKPEPDLAVSSSQTDMSDVQTIDCQSQTDIAPKSQTQETQTKSVKGPNDIHVGMKIDIQPLPVKVSEMDCQSQTDMAPRSHTQETQTKSVKGPNDIHVGMQIDIQPLPVKISEKTRELDRIAMQCFCKSIQTIQSKMVSKAIQTDPKKEPTRVHVSRPKPKPEKNPRKESNYKYTEETLRNLSLIK